jgi:hypothetical protein
VARTVGLKGLKELIFSNFPEIEFVESSGFKLGLENFCLEIVCAKIVVAGREIGGKLGKLWPAGMEGDFIAKPDATGPGAQRPAPV